MTITNYQHKKRTLSLYLLFSTEPLIFRSSDLAIYRSTDPAIYILYTSYIAILSSSNCFICYCFFFIVVVYSFYQGPIQTSLPDLGNPKYILFKTKINKQLKSSALQIHPSSDPQIQQSSDLPIQRSTDSPI